MQAQISVDATAPRRMILQRRFSLLDEEFNLGLYEVGLNLKFPLQ